MPQNEEQNQQEKQQLEEYFSFIKDAAKSGEYFSDALDWYVSRYVNPIVDRTVMLLVSVIAAVSLYFLFQIVSNAFPLVEEVPVIIRDHDTATLRPMIHALRDKNDKSIKNVDEAVARYLLGVYVADREAYDFRDSDVSEVNEKFDRVKNNSSLAEYKNFQLFMSRENENSPINNFGRDVYKTVEIQSVSFSRKDFGNDYGGRIKSLFKTPIPEQAEVKFKTTLHSKDENGQERQVSDNYLARINFKFGGVNPNAKGGILRFSVNDYKLFRIK